MKRRTQLSNWETKKSFIQTVADNEFENTENASRYGPNPKASGSVVDPEDQGVKF